MTKLLTGSRGRVDTLHLVKFREFLFPLDLSDYHAMKERECTVFRMHESTVGILGRTLLKGLKIDIHPWKEVYPPLLERFKSKLTDSEPGAFEIKSEANWVMTRHAPEAEIDKFLQATIDQLVSYMGRYGIKTLVEKKPREPYLLTRITFIPDPEIAPETFFVPEVSSRAPLEFKMRFSDACQLHFIQKPETKTLSVSFEDRTGDEYRESFSRAFAFSRMKIEDCYAGIDFFSNLLSKIKAKPLGR